MHAFALDGSQLRKGGAERQTDIANATDAQSHPVINLCRAWMRCTTAERARFLADIGAGIARREDDHKTALFELLPAPGEPTVKEGTQITTQTLAGGG